MMGYKNWSGSRASLTLSADWYEIEELMRYLQTITRNYLGGSLSDFQDTKNLIFPYPPFSKDAPFKSSIRFPEKGKFICAIVGRWNWNFTQLRTICMDAVRDKAVDKSTLSLYRKIIVKMIDDILCGSSVFDRDSFEAWADVVWTETLESPMP